MTEERCQEKHERMGLDCFIASAIVSGITSSKAAGAQSAAAQQAYQGEEGQIQQNTLNQQPYMTAGTTALNTIGQDQANGTGFATPFSLANFTSNPGYQFQLQQGQNAINSSAAAMGGTLNGGTLKALDQYTTGLANTTYGDAYNRYLANSQEGYNQLFGVAQLGEGATSTLGAQNTNAQATAGNFLTQKGNAQASGDVGVGNAINGYLSGAGGAALYANQQQQNQSQSGYGKLLTLAGG